MSNLILLKSEKGARDENQLLLKKKNGIKTCGVLNSSKTVCNCAEGHKKKLLKQFHLKNGFFGCPF